jgi:cytochrome c6
VNVQKLMLGLVKGWAIAALLTVSLTSPTWAEGLTASAQPSALFEVHCSGCHLNGGNIIRRGKNLKLKALQKNKVDSVAAIATLIANGKNNMSAYRDKLSTAEINALADYVLAQAEQGWPKG